MEAEGYGRWTRVREVAELARRLDYGRLGVASCPDMMLSDSWETCDPRPIPHRSSAAVFLALPTVADDSSDSMIRPLPRSLMSDVVARLNAALHHRYAIERELGEGGMASVYLAEDLKHHREVAIKVLKPELAAVLGAERFVQEITTTAQLQHPNILPLFDSGRAVAPRDVGAAEGSGSVAGQTGGGEVFLYYVMPYVEGESLRDKLDRETQLPVEEAVKITTEVADALDYAHRHGVIHRDIKPENILLHDGRPMVADFGIALAVSAAAGGRMTETGLSLGTPHYMSPEQATAEKEITGRSDIYSLASVLYEMLTGDPPHVGSTAQQIIVRIITDEARPVREVRKSVPTNVAAALWKALQKLPADRFDSAQDFAHALADAHFTVAEVEAGRDVGTAATSPSWLRDPRTVAVIGVALVAVALALWGWLRPPPTLPLVEREVVLGSANRPGLISAGVAIAPDGSAIAYPALAQATGSAGTVAPTAAGRLMLKEGDRITPLPLATVHSAPGPSFSPNGESIAFIEDGRLMRVPRSGGAPVVLSDSAVTGSVAWLDSDTILALATGQAALLAVPAQGGPTRRVFTVDSTGDYLTRVSAVPGADAAILSVGGPRPRAVALDLRTRRAHNLQPGAMSSSVVDGHLVYVQTNGGLYAAPFDVGRLAVAGSPATVLDSVSGTDVAIGRDGTLVYLTGAGSGPAQPNKLVRVSLGGSVERLDTAQAVMPAAGGGLDLSPDGKRVAVTVLDPASGHDDIDVFDLRGRAPVRLTLRGTLNIRPAWSPDGQRIMYASDAGGRMALWVRRADGSTPARLLVSDPRGVWGGEWSPDGRWIVYRTDNASQGNGDIVGLPTQGDTTRVPLVATPGLDLAPAVSPDGRWLAYSSNRSGHQDVYVQPFPKAGGTFWLVSSGGGVAPRWSHDGRHIFYVDPSERVMAADVEASPTFAVVRRRVLFSLSSTNIVGMSYPPYHSYAVTPDDEHFLTLEALPAPAGRAGRVIEIDHWHPGSGVKPGG